MKMKIGFTTPTDELHENIPAVEETVAAPAAKASLVQVYFSQRNLTLTYFNDSFDLQKGDYVYVEGKLEGVLGRVAEVSYNFKIKPADYKRVLHVVDTKVQGEFVFAGSYFLTFDPKALPYEQAASWFKAPDADEVFAGKDETTLCLEDVKSWNMKPQVMDRAYEYFMENRVRYLSLTGDRCRAVVEGTSVYEVEFRFSDGLVSELSCDCFCVGGCKHEAAVMMQLRESLAFIADNYAEQFAESGCFAAVFKPALFTFAVDGNEKGSFALG